VYSFGVSSQQELNLINDVEEQPGFPLRMNGPAIKAEHETGRPQEFDDQVAAALALNDEDILSRDYGVIQPEQLIVVRAYGDDSDDMLLSELRPRWVIMYDPNQDFLRRIEVCESVAFKCSSRLSCLFRFIVQFMQDSRFGFIS
jgi:hypothetical protein